MERPVGLAEPRGGGHMNASKSISRKNIRATADPDFWGNEYDESLYLWFDAQHRLKLNEMIGTSVPTLSDPRESKEARIEAETFTRATYYKYLTILTGKLNELHGLDMSESFWQTAFGLWLYRHICIVYDKYLHLRQLGVDRTDIKLLSRNSFYIPNDHYDYIFYFGGDRGVLQLVSDYYYLFATKEFDEIERPYESYEKRCPALNPMANLILQEERVRQPGGLRTQELRPAIRPGSVAWARMITQRLINRGGTRSAKGNSDSNGVGNTTMPLMSIIGAFYNNEILEELAEKSGGEIKAMKLPAVAACERDVDHNGRAFLADIDGDDAFDKYLARTLSYGIPKILVEYFSDYFDSYSEHVERGRCTNIVTEAWISFMPVSIYCAIARQKRGVKLIMQEHGASQQWLCGSPDWIGMEVADVFLTTGWHGGSKKVVRGGFAKREIAPYRFEQCKRDILHVSTSSFLYRCDFYGVASSSARFSGYLQQAASLFESLPLPLQEHYLLRPRRSPYLWDTEHTWDIVRKGGRVEADGDLLSLLAEARIVVVDHLSTSVAEIFLMGVPVLILHDDYIEPLAVEHTTLFDDLKVCGVVHGSVASAVTHLARIYDDVESWWKGREVQQAIEEIVSANLGPPSQTVDHLVALLNSSRAKSDQETGAPRIGESVA
jgi:hypothetical protein